MKALVAKEKGSFANLQVRDDRPAPEVVEPTDVVVKVVSGALNPVDWKMLMFDFFVKQWPHVFGCDMAGTIKALGDGAYAAGFRVGDRVWAYTSLGDFHSGTLAELVKVPCEFLGRVPEGMGFDEASTIGVGVLTAAMLYFQACKGADVSYLVYGASSAVGQFAVQIAKLEGKKVVAVASKANSEMLVGLGADVVIDYHDEGWQDAVISALGAEPEAAAIDPIGTNDTLAACRAIVKACGGSTVATTETNYKSSTDDGVAVVPVNLGSVYDQPEQRSEVAAYMKPIGAWLAEGKLKPMAVRVAGGLSDVPKAFQEMMEGKVRAEKLVIHPDT